jgi:hypothetical protein
MWLTGVRLPFVAVSELALDGLTGIGMVLFLMLLASLLGGWVEVELTSGAGQGGFRPKADFDAASAGLVAPVMRQLVSRIHST